jgi:MscS family membrane protein
MKRIIAAKIVIFLLFLWGYAGLCLAADPIQAVHAIKAAEQPQPPGNAAQTPPPESLPPQTPDALTSFLDQITSFFKDKNITGIWTKNDPIDWIVLLTCIFVGMIAGRVCSLLLTKTASRTWSIPAKFLSDLAGPANLFLVTLGLTFGFMGLWMAQSLSTFFGKMLLLLFYSAVFWYVYNLISIVDVAFQRLSRSSESSLAMHVAPLVRRTLRVFLVVIASMFVVQSVFEQNIGTWLAGLGIAGLAVSLAAQDSLKNLIGSITIVFDQSFKIGERIICTGCDGVIEDIGLRATRVRTAGGHLVSIPNSNIVNSPIENVSRRPAIRRNFTLALKLDTPADKIKSAIKIVRDILDAEDICRPIHPTIKGKVQAPQVSFSDYKENSLILSVTYWYAPPNNDQYLTHSEKINLRILEEFNRAEIKLINS